MEKRRKVLIGAVAVAGLVIGGAGLAFGDDRDDDRPPTGAEFERVSAAALAEVGDGTVTDTDRDDGRYEVEVTRPDGTEVDVVLDDDLAVVAATPDRPSGGAGDGRDDRDDREVADVDADDRPLTASERERAAAAAVTAAGGGTATDVDAAEDGTGYDVEVVRPDGTEVDVRLGPDLAEESVTPDLDD